jgi:hypothetical protein
MIRFCAFAVLGLALVLGGTVGAEAGKCTKTGLLTGKTKTWSCKSGQVCCSAPILGYYGCGKNQILGCVKL